MRGVEALPTQASTNSDRENHPGLSNNDDGDDASMQADGIFRPAVIQRKDPSAHIVPVAFLVEEGSRDGDLVIDAIAEPVLPWYKQKQKRRILALVLLVFAALAIALGISLSNEIMVTNNVFPPTLSPTVSAKPSVQSTGSPSSSLEPSSSPSACVYQNHLKCANCRFAT